MLDGFKYLFIIIYQFTYMGEYSDWMIKRQKNIPTNNVTTTLQTDNEIKKIAKWTNFDLREKYSTYSLN